jgi:antitoxin (DNA-binding transcriptional repressor) of toxin-antitoxin stability system
MRQVGAFEAKNTFGSLLDLVEQGEEVVITRHGKPVARMVREATQADPRPALDALRRIRNRIKTADAARFEWEQWKRFRDEGRR